MQGLQKDSTIKETIEKIDEHTAKRYRVVEEVINLDQLRKEKEALEAQLAEEEPSDEVLANLGMSIHEFYHRDLDSIRTRISEIDTISGI